MDLHACILYLYPDAVAFKDFELMALDKGPFISKWNMDAPKPTQEELEALWSKVELEKTRKEKIEELDRKCTETIYGYFKVSIDGIEYEFSYDEQAQSRFNGIAAMFALNAIANIDWTAYIDGQRTRVTLDKLKFLQVAAAAAQHQDNNIVKFNQLLNNVNTEENPNTIKVISW